MIYMVCISCGRPNTEKALYQLQIVDHMDVPINESLQPGHITLCDWCIHQFNQKFMKRETIYNLSNNATLPDRNKVVDAIMNIIRTYPGTVPPSFKTVTTKLNLLGFTAPRGGPWLMQNLQQFMERNGIEKNAVFFLSRKELMERDPIISVHSSSPVEDEPITSII